MTRQHIWNTHKILLSANQQKWLTVRHISIIHWQQPLCCEDLMLTTGKCTVIIWLLWFSHFHFHVYFALTLNDKQDRIFNSGDVVIMKLILIKNNGSTAQWYYAEGFAQNCQYPKQQIVFLTILLIESYSNSLVKG